ncbi:MAG: F0F1 ATP synthase subunit delta [Patescibacteria group bacterium]
MTNLTKDARFFVDGVTKYIRRGGMGNTMLPKVTAALKKISSSSGQQTAAIVESAVGLTSKERAELSRFLSRLLTHTVTIECRREKALIGGIRVTVGDWVVDTSIATQIAAMQEELTK